ncbi:transformer-2b6, variant [Loa loa]|uniref:Transformer-2b6, variant n=1 Tax=Loa loa TaxID=7209 RepID=A0A1I7VTP7_LOALO|nr:transformer-2b6, variant [Loa loa]EJD75619.1 transformer-2b6, variant [Loa loa]
MDDWNIDGQEDVLAGGSETLDEMMDSLASGLDAFSATNFLERDIGRGVQIVPCTLGGLLEQREKEQKTIQKKILKVTPRDGRELSNTVSLKKVTFDVEKFAADECGDAEERGEARARLALKLGALPSKNNYFNYKQLKEELNVKKNLEIEFDRLSALKSLKKLSMKKKEDMWKEGSKSSESKSNGDKTSDERKSGDVVERSDEDSRSGSPSEASRSRSRDRRHSSSCSRSRSKSRLRSSRRSRSPRYRRSSYDDRRYTFSRRDEPEPSRCLGVFGLSLYTTERDLKELFSQYGDLDNVQLVFDHPTGRSRGFGFVYFKKIEDAIEAKERVAGTEIDGHKIRIDYSITKRPHTPTPGIYMGAVDSRRRGPPRSYRRSPSPYRSYRRYRDSPPNRYYTRGYDYDDYDRYSPPYRDRYRRSPSPRYYDDRHRRRSRSYDRDRDYY